MAFDIQGAKKAGYSDAEIADYLSQQGNFDAPGARKSGYSDADIIQHLSSGAAPTPVDDVPQWGRENPNLYGVAGAFTEIGKNIVGSAKGLGQAALNLPGSTIDLVNNIGKAVLSPVETVQGLGEITVGGVQKLIPGEQRNEEKFDAVADFFKERYGSNEGLYKAITEDPAGVMGDLSTVLTGGGAALTRVAPQASQALATAGRAVDPLNVASRVAKTGADAGGKLTREVLGATTGAGPEAINQALRGQGLTSNTSDFVRGMRGKVGGEDILKDSKNALAKVKENRSELYRQRLSEIAKDGTPIDIRPIKSKAESLMRQFGVKRLPEPKKGMHGTSYYDFSRSTIDPKARGDVEAVLQTVDDWGRQQGDNTAIGLDTLKRQLDDFYNDSSNSRALVTALRNEVKSQIVNNVPEYATMTKDYETITRLTNEMERALSLGKRPMMDTAIKKLSSTMRENFGFRRELLKQLEELSGQDLSAVIAGADMNQVIPKGLVGKLAGGGVVGAGYMTGQLANPYLVSMAAMSSPRVMGEFLNALGFTKNQAQKVIAAAAKSKAFTTGKRGAAFQAGRATQDPAVQTSP